MSAIYRAAVLGSPIAHSLSPVLHNAGYRAAGLSEWEYERIELTAEELPGFVLSCDESYRGFSVTMPGKFAALELATEATDRARRIGSANTLVRVPGGWRADNTDVDGLVGALGRLLRGGHPGDVLLLGAGGTARPALVALATMGATSVTVLNRSDRSAELAPILADAETELRCIGYDSGEDLDHLVRRHDMVLSTVPSSAIADKVRSLGRRPVLDVIYDPWPTPLCVQAAANGFRTVGGHVMLAHQSFGQFEQFTGHAAPRHEMTRALKAELGL